MAYKLNMTGKEFTDWMSSVEYYFGQIYDWSIDVNTQ